MGQRQAAQLSQSGQGVAPKMELDPEYRKVLETLAESRSMPFLELTAVCDIGDDKRNSIKELKSIIDVLESYDMVKVINRDNILEEIVTLKKKGLEVIG